jgi:hypothetical protein
MPRKRKADPVRIDNNVQDSSEAMQRVKNLVAEFFDHAIIIASNEVEGRTEFLQTTVGNAFAVKGMAETFLSGYVNDEITDVDDDDDIERVY